MGARFLAALIVALALCACSEDRPTTVATPTTPTAATATPTTPTPPTSTPSIPPPVRGRVVDFQTKNPISGAVVGFASGIGLAGSFVGMTQTAVTNANGEYSLPQPLIRSRADLYYLVVSTRGVGRIYPLGVNNRAGDVAVHAGLCVTRYGMVLDSQTFLPIVGAEVRSLGSRVLATTDRDGWYQFDFGCSTGSTGFNTTWVTAMHPDYTSQDFSRGRGFQGVFREDVALTRR